MSDTPVAEQAAERESLKTRNWVLGSALAVLFLIIQSFFTYTMSSAVSKADKWGDKLEKVCTAQEVQQIKNDLYDTRLNKLETKAEEDAKTRAGYEQRLGGLEQRQSITDVYMASHK